MQKCWPSRRLSSPRRPPDAAGSPHFSDGWARVESYFARWRVSPQAGGDSLGDRGIGAAGWLRMGVILYHAARSAEGLVVDARADADDAESQPTAKTAALDRPAGGPRGDTGTAVSSVFSAAVWAGERISCAMDRALTNREYMDRVSTTPSCGGSPDPSRP